MEDREQFDIQLLAPLPGNRRATRREVVADPHEGEDFMAFMTAVKGA